MKQEGRLASFFDSAPFGIVVTDQQHRIRRVNEVMAGIIGRPSPDIVGLELAAVAPALAIVLTPFLEEAMKLDRAVSRDYSGELAPTGSRYVIQCFPIHDDSSDGHLVGTIIASTPGERPTGVLDETRTKELEQRIADSTDELRQSQETYRTLFENAPIAYYNVDLDGLIRRWNKATEELFGVSGDNIGNKHITQFYAPESIPKAERLFEQFARGEGWRNEEMAYVKPDGQKAYVLLSVTPILDADGNVVESLSMDVDVTDLKRAEQLLLDAQDELLRKERLATLGQLIGTVSHELRNPLGTIKSSFDTVRRRLGETTERLTVPMDRIERNIRRCSQIIADLMDFARVHELQFENVDMDAWAAEVLAGFDVPNGLDLRTDLGSGVSLTIDPRRLAQAVENVVQNACQAIEERSSNRQEPVIELATRVEGTRFELTVTDTGDGIPSEVQDKIFEPLYSTRTFGVGLGLPLVVSTMNQHHGGIEVNSSAGEGTAVTLWLPLRVRGET